MATQNLRAPVRGRGTWVDFMPDGLSGRVVDVFTYEADFLPVNANAQLQVDVQIQNDSNFVILGAFAQVTETDNVTFLAYPAWPFLIAATDSTTGRQITSRAVPLASFAPQAAPGFIPWLQPKFMAAGATLSTTLTNQSATNRNVRLSYIGAKVFGM